MSKPTRPRIDVNQIKARYALSSIVGKSVKLRRAGHEFVGLCPFHAEKTPSFRVNDTKGLYHCFGCGAHGDAFKFLHDKDGLSFIDAVNAITSGEIPETAPIDRSAAAAIEQQERAAAIKEAFRQWASARSVVGTPAEIYLRSRGLTMPMPWSIRFTWARPRFDRETGEAAGQLMPALIAACQNKDDKIVGVQRVFLTRDGKKANMLNPKLSLGQTRGCAVRLGPVARKIILLEGPEDGLTIRQKFPDESVWISLGTGGLPHVELPDAIQEIALGGDNNAAGRAAVSAATESYAGQGRSVSDFFPASQYEDFNDEHLGIVMA